MKRLEVRCCCNPNKVLGYLTHPRLQELGDSWQFTVIDNSRLPDILVVPGAPELSTIRTPMMQVQLSVDRYSDGNGVVREAIKNRDYPLSTLRCIRGFEPLTWEPSNG